MGRHARNARLIPASENDEFGALTPALPRAGRGGRRTHAEKLIPAFAACAMMAWLAAQEGRMARVWSAEQDAGFNLARGVTPGGRLVSKPRSMS